jgi:hypothetical protein
MIQNFLFAHFLSNENGALRNAKMELKFEVIEGALRITGGDGKRENRHDRRR